MEHPSPTLTVDLGAVARNTQRILAAASGARLFAVVKANAYGLGAVDVARAALAGGASMLVVARGEELRPLRAFEVHAPALVLAETATALLPELAQGATAFTVWDRRQLSDYARLGVRLQKHIPLHIEVDTGMHRLGAGPDAVPDLAAEIVSEPGLKLAGLFTHFSSSDDPDPSVTLAQWERFSAVRAELAQRNIPVPIVHAASSAALIRFPQTHADAVRVGLLLSGCSPFPAAPFEVEPAVFLHASILRIATVPPGDGIGYGLTDAATTVRRIATVGIGYADGVRRGPVPAVEALSHGRRIPRVGRVSMDLTTFDVTQVPAASVGDRVTLIGTDGAERISVQDVAHATGTIPWEVLTGISPRVRRVHLPVEAGIETEQLRV